jgi:elongation factor Ts
MQEVTTSMIVDLRSKTGAGMMDCKGALTEAKGDFEAAVTILRKKGLAVANKRASKVTKEGRIYSYIHPGDKIGVMVELNCETDFVARTDDFKALCKEVAMQIAAMSPKWLKPEDVPAAEIEKEKDILKTQAQKEGKNEKMMDKIIEGRINKFYQQNCLLDQLYIRDPQNKLVVKDLFSQAVGKMGENISIRRFVRYQLGGE